MIPLWGYETRYPKGEDPEHWEANGKGFRSRDASFRASQKWVQELVRLGCDAEVRTVALNEAARDADAARFMMDRAGDIKDALKGIDNG